MGNTNGIPYFTSLSTNFTALVPGVLGETLMFGDVIPLFLGCFVHVFCPADCQQMCQFRCKDCVEGCVPLRTHCREEEVYIVEKVA